MLVASKCSFLSIYLIRLQRHVLLKSHGLVLQFWHVGWPRFDVSARQAMAISPSFACKYFWSAHGDWQPVHCVEDPRNPHANSDYSRSCDDWCRDLGRRNCRPSGGLNSLWPESLLLAQGNFNPTSIFSCEVPPCKSISWMSQSYSK